MLKKPLAVFLVLAFFAGLLAGCGGGTLTAATPAPEAAQDVSTPAPAAATEIPAPQEPEVDEDENYDTGDASLDNPLNADGIGEKELLVVSFGTSYNNSRRETIGAVEQAMIKAFPEYSVRRAFTSQIIIDHIQRRDGVKIDNLTEALDRAVANGVKELVVQPTHLMNGLEYNDIIEEVARYADSFESIRIGHQLLDTDTDFAIVALAIALPLIEEDDGETAFVFMGHGTEAESNAVYARMQGMFDEGEGNNVFIGTVEAKPGVDDVLAAVQAGSYKRVRLQPLMVVAGDHANNDMAGDEPDSWKSIFTKAGYEVECVLEGLGSNEIIQSLYVEHARNAIDEDYGTGDASLDDPRNADGIGENELLVVSFGTSYNDSRRETIGAIEQALEDAFPEYSLRRGFTSNIIIDHIQRRDGVKIDDINEALDRAVANGVKKLVVQPTHLMNGFEYNDLVDTVAMYADAFESVAIGRPILDTEADFRAVAQAITAATAEYDDGETAIVFMGHGTEAESNAVYAQMQQVLNGMGKTNYYIGTVEAKPSVEDVLEAVKAGNYKRVVLEPLMIVAGDHANNDMAGGEADSWDTLFREAGYEVIPVLRGLGSFTEIQTILAAHAQDAINSLK
ncbi:MAG: sirohydrochlorin cobaltochelatase [Oscillospiraceae bacterium]|nr:sirohydrochlorin cobaltochelatase [Oscillospiraceae bacterium]